MKIFRTKPLICKWLVIAAAALCLAPKSQADQGLMEFGFSNDREGIVELLGLLGNQGNAADFYNEIVNELDSDDFVRREQATQKLSKMPVIDRVLLEKLADKAPPEAAIRIRRVLKSNSLERFDNMVSAVLDAIIKGKEKGLVEFLFKALDPRGNYGKGEIWKKAGEAAQVTADPSDINDLSLALKSKSDVVRSASVQALVKVAGQGAGDIILPVADDASPYVTWEVARGLALLGRHECLKPFA